MTHSTIADTDIPTVTDVDTDKAILVARIHQWATDHALYSTAETVLTEIGLADLLPGGPQPYTLDLSALRDAIPVELDLLLRKNQTDSYELAGRVDEHIIGHLSAFKQKLHDQDITAIAAPAQPGRIDVDAALEQWGPISSPYPKAGTDEVEQFRRQTAKAAMRFGEARRYCGALEDAFRDVGLTDYLPPREKTFSIEIPGDLAAITFTVPLDRAGEIGRRTFMHQLAREIARQIADRDDSIPPEVVA